LNFIAALTILIIQQPIIKFNGFLITGWKKAELHLTAVKKFKHTAGALGTNALNLKVLKKKSSNQTKNRLTKKSGLLFYPGKKLLLW